MPIPQSSVPLQYGRCIPRLSTEECAFMIASEVSYEVCVQNRPGNIGVVRGGGSGADADTTP
jgi:hypothetical protein